jgi:urease accessory protein UreH
VKEREFTGEIEVKNVNGKSTISNIYNRYPLKFLTPKIAPDISWVYMVNFGGGLVSFIGN